MIPLVKNLPFYSSIPPPPAKRTWAQLKKLATSWTEPFQSTSTYPNYLEYPPSERERNTLLYPRSIIDQTSPQQIYITISKFSSKGQTTPSLFFPYHYSLLLQLVTRKSTKSKITPPPIVSYRRSTHFAEAKKCLVVRVPPPRRTERERERDSAHRRNKIDCTREERRGGGRERSR